MLRLNSIERTCLTDYAFQLRDADSMMLVARTSSPRSEAGCYFATT
jgi:hypothetical protein